MGPFCQQGQGGAVVFSPPCPPDGGSPSFPSQITRAATWNTQLLCQRNIAERRWKRHECIKSDVWNTHRHIQHKRMSALKMICVGWVQHWWRGGYFSGIYIYICLFSLVGYYCLRFSWLGGRKAGRKEGRKKARKEGRQLQNFAQIPSAATIAVIKGRFFGETPWRLFFGRAKLHYHKPTNFAMVMNRPDCCCY